MAIKKRRRNRLPARATSVRDLSDDLLEVVLLGLDSPVCLVRAAATCKRWRRVVADADGAFLCRFRCLHAPPAIGTYYSVNPPCSYGRRFPNDLEAAEPVFAPSPASASDEPGAHRISLDLDFLPPTGGSRELVDGRGSLLLLFKEKDGTQRVDGPGCMCCAHGFDYVTPDLVVCEPLTRRYEAIRPPYLGVCMVGAFLLDGEAADEAIGFTNFRVLLVLYEHDVGRPHGRAQRPGLPFR
ncbi:hypothetical protein C2845_PM03G31790 [Panicum miliaceum]|uniref:F-box domain-containing protein n=1 Tax=Panicum miliaceum TaxID=4540 RepID=A0A3L6TAK0_PANMI|nr:hypothetical protein C2845_PM03G31790 [Panicum miliaceum]